MELFLTPLSATFLPFTLKLNHRLFQKIIGITLISHQAFASSASVLTTQHYILQLSNIINEEAKHLPCGHEISHLLSLVYAVCVWVGQSYWFSHVRKKAFLVAIAPLRSMVI